MYTHSPLQTMPSHRGPGRGRGSRTSTTEAFGTLATSVSGAVEDFLRTMTPPGMQAPVMDQRMRGYGHGYDYDHGCGYCGQPECRCQPTGCDCGWSPCACDAPCPTCRPDPCNCVCCVGDVDLVIYARLGELRVTPIEIHNPRRRAKSIELDLSAFTVNTQAGVTVIAALLGETKFELGPCETAEVILATFTRPVLDDDVAGVSAPAAGIDANLAFMAAAAEQPDRRAIPDVEGCAVAKADLRVKGCDVRPVQIALALLPRDCGAYEISCKAGCC